MWSELIYLHKQQAFVSSLYQSYVKDSIEFSKLRATNWQDLEAPAFEMPTNVELFEWEGFILSVHTTIFFSSM